MNEAKKVIKDLVGRPMVGRVVRWLCGSSGGYAGHQEVT